MQDETGLRKALSSGWIYSWFQSAIGARRTRRWLAANVWRCTGEETVVDVGCGTGDMLEQLPPGIRYVGIDISAAYIERARKRFGARGRFLVGTADTVLERSSSDLVGADLVVSNGLLHHLSDREAMGVLRLAAAVLRPNGRFVAFEPTYLQHQSSLGRWIMEQDRGKNIRTDAEWRKLVLGVFPDSSARVLTGLLRLPYTHILLESTHGASSVMRAEQGDAWPESREVAAGR